MELQISKLAESILGQIRIGLEQVYEAAKQYAELRKTRPEIRDAMIEAGADKGFCDRLENMGNGKFDSRLFLKSGIQYRLVEKLPLVTDQREIIEKGVLVLEPDGQDERIIPLDDLTPEQARQAIGKTPAQQRTFINSKIKKPKLADPDYVVLRNKIRIMKPMDMDQGLLLSLAQQIAK